jgi:hypothetical protein
MLEVYMKKLLLFSIALLALLPASGFAYPRTAIIAGPAFGPYGWYGWSGPYYGPYPYGPFSAAPATGQIKLDTDVKDAEVFINGNYAGIVKQLKTMMMTPGKYDISIHAPGRQSFEQQVYILAGKTLKLHPDLRLQTQ